MARILAITPLRSARSTFSIFIASTMHKAWPSCTSSPSATSMRTTSPGIGQSRNFDVSGGAFSGISAASSAWRGVRTETARSAPR